MDNFISLFMVVMGASQKLREKTQEGQDLDEEVRQLKGITEALLSRECCLSGHRTEGHIAAGNCVNRKGTDRVSARRERSKM